MSKNLKSFLTRMTVYVIIMCGITAGINLYRASVAPVVSTELALRQFDNTEEGHIAMRAYTNATNNWSAFGLMSFSIALYIVIVGSSVNRLLFSKEASKKESK